MMRPLTLANSEVEAMDIFRRALTQFGVLAAHPMAFVVVAAYGFFWFIFDRENFGWHAFAVLATWGMTLLIQRAEHRDTQAIHAKLDELIHAQARARNALPVSTMRSLRISSG